MSITTTTKRDQSRALFARAQQTLVGGVNSPVRAFRAVGGDPVFVDRVEGATIYDVDGNRYVDLVGTWGPAIVGHAHPEVVSAVKQAADKGLSFGACCAAEAELGELILSGLPAMEMIRFVNSGTEACMSAVRLARAATGRNKIIKFLGCYHGHADPMLVAAGSGAATLGSPDSAGVPDSAVADTLMAAYNDIDAVSKIFAEHGHNIAGVFVEPIGGNMGFVPPASGFLETLRQLCDQHAALLVFDEVMTGFRVAWGGYQKLANIAPDITCLGKVVGGGMPVAAYAARRNIMQHVSPLGSMYQAGTLSGNPLGMASGIATLRICQQNGFYEALTQKGKTLVDGVLAAASEADIAMSGGVCGGMLGLSFTESPVTNFVEAQAGDHAAYGKFFNAMLDRGVWLPPSSYEAMFLSAAHSDDDIQHIITAATESLRSLKS
jgi:glutamate-1-semialdehyde 2,1-aminomutase